MKNLQELTNIKLPDITPEQIESTKTILQSAYVKTIEAGSYAYDIFCDRVRVEAIAWIICYFLSFISLSVLQYYGVKFLKRYWEQSPKCVDKYYCEMEEGEVGHPGFGIISFIYATIILASFVFESYFIFPHLPEVIANVFVPEAKVIIEASKFIKN